MIIIKTIIMMIIVIIIMIIIIIIIIIWLHCAEFKQVQTESMKTIESDLRYVY